MKYIVQILFAYLMAAPLTDKVELNLANTEWTNILTYVWIAGAGAAWMAIFMAGVFVLALIASMWDR